MASSSVNEAVGAIGESGERKWREKYARRLVVSDLLVLVWVIFGVQIAWFGLDTNDVSLRSRFGDLGLSYTVISVVILVAWMSILSIYGTRGYRVIGSGSQEYRLLADATLRVFGLLAIVAFLFKIDLARGYILIALPLGLVVLIFSRWMWRLWLGVQRANGQYSSRVLLVGSESSIVEIARELRRQPQSGYVVVGACVQNDIERSLISSAGIAVFGDFDHVLESLRSSGSDTVIVTSADALPATKVREISWGLEAGREHLVVAPSLVDVGGPRIHTRPVAGLPLIHVETPRYEGGKKFAKRAFDIFGSGALILALSPVLLTVAMVVRLSSAGPVLYRQERVGRNGQPFEMLKFRSMRVNADAELQGLLAAQGTSDSPLFKVRDDPRITPVGGFLRKHSVDEFPQLLNVFKGDMSLVGPRPQREGEVRLYDSAAKRRLIVQPGMTGLWQVSGRSSLSWEDAIRLDLYYVENWSLTSDILILWKTVRAVVSPGKDAF